MRTWLAVLLLCCASACLDDESGTESKSPEDLGEVTQGLNRRCDASRRNSSFVIKNGYEWGDGSWCCTSLPSNGGDITCYNCTSEWVSCTFF